MPNVPLNKIDCSVPTMTFLHNSEPMTRPITDHSPIIQNTLWGAIGSLNILHPGSPIAPQARINDVNSTPVEGQQQMELMAEYIFKMFKQGVGLLALQEIPDPSSPNFKYLKDKLTELVGDSNLIDVNSLTTHWLTTGRHTFGTTILCNPSQFKLSGGHKAELNNRVGCYEVTAIPSGQVIPVANLHGDYSDQLGTIAYIDNFEGFCLGDTNILHDSKHIKKPKPKTWQSYERPILQIESQRYQLDTLDLFQDTFSQKINRNFIPDSTCIFTPVVIKMPANSATTFLKQFSDQLPSQFVQLGRSIGTDLKTPKGGSDSYITISTAEVYNFFLQFQAVWINQQKVVEDQTKQTPSIDTAKNQVTPVVSDPQKMVQHSQPPVDSVATFVTEENSIQQGFIRSLNEFHSKIGTIAATDPVSYAKGQEVYNILFQAQNDLFIKLTPDSDDNSIEANIAGFRKVCDQQVNEADKIMGHGWLYRIAEVLIKAVVGLFASIVMTVGVVAGQGLAKAEHRTAFKNTFFTWNQTDASKILNEFKDKELGDGNEDQSILDKKDKFAP